MRKACKLKTVTGHAENAVVASRHRVRILVRGSRIQIATLILEVQPNPSVLFPFSLSKGEKVCEKCTADTDLCCKKNLTVFIWKLFCAENWSTNLFAITSCGSHILFCVHALTMLCSSCDCLAFCLEKKQFLEWS